MIGNGLHKFKIFRAFLAIYLFVWSNNFHRGQCKCKNCRALR